MDLHTRLQRFGGPIEAVPEDTIEADLARGQRAMKRRHLVQAVGGSTFAVAAIVATVAFSGATTGGTGGPSHPPAVVQGTAGAEFSAQATATAWPNMPTSRQALANELGVRCGPSIRTRAGSSEAAQPSS